MSAAVHSGRGTALSSTDNPAETKRVGRAVLTHGPPPAPPSCAESPPRSVVSARKCRSRSVSAGDQQRNSSATRDAVADIPDGLAARVSPMREMWVGAVSRTRKVPRQREWQAPRRLAPGPVRRMRGHRQADDPGTSPRPCHRSIDPDTIPRQRRRTRRQAAGGSGTTASKRRHARLGRCVGSPEGDSRRRGSRADQHVGPLRPADPDQNDDTVVGRVGSVTL